MDKQHSRLSVAPDSECARLMRDAVAAGGAIEVDTGDEVYHLEINRAAELAGQKRRRELAHRLAGSLAAVDISGWETSEAAENWVADLRRTDMYPLDPPRTS
jgi:hypothetical protein